MDITTIGTGSSKFQAGEDPYWTQFCANSDQHVQTFVKNTWIAYILVVFFVLVYSVPIVIVLVRRNYPETKARSPILTAICMSLLLLDTVFNTWIFGVNP